MGRAERRRQERLDRFESRKGKLLVSREEMKKIREESAYEASTYDVKTLLTCLSLAEYKVHNMDSDQIADTLTFIDQLVDDVTNGKATFDDYRKILEDEVGIIVECDD